MRFLTIKNFRVILYKQEYRSLTRIVLIYKRFYLTIKKRKKFKKDQKEDSIESTIKKREFRLLI